MGKVEMRVEVDTKLVERARAAGIAFDEAAEIGLRIALADAGRGRPLGVVAGHLRQMADRRDADEARSALGEGKCRCHTGSQRADRPARRVW